MKNFYPIMQASLPFRDMSDTELQSIVGTLGLSVSRFRKGSTLFSQGQVVTHSGVLLEGSVIAESVSYAGERRVLQTLSPGDLFGDVLMSSENHPTPVSTYAKEDSLVVFIEFTELVANSCDPLCRRVLMNMLHGIADKFWFLNRRIAYLSCKSLRGRVAMFLLDTSKEASALMFSIPYSREELASVLGANRTALSRELSRMQEENIISFYKNSFKIEDTEKLKGCLHI